MSTLGYLGIPRIEVMIPSSVEEALNLLQTHPDAEILAAGTHIITQLTLGIKRTRKYIDINNLHQLRKISHHHGTASVGSLVTHQELAATLMNQVPAFTAFLQKYSSPAVANRATVGGSIMLRLAGEDLIPILLTLDAELSFATLEGVKNIPLKAFLARGFDGRGLLQTISFKLNSSCFFDKLWMGVSRIPLISIAVSRDGADGVRVAVSHKDGSTPGRVAAVEKFLSMHGLSEEVVEKASRLMMDSINPESDVLASSWYRRRAAGVLLKRLLQNLRG
ncbi:carbon monoxide dehydrogenase medium subunit [Candidatus Caldarchaeum subterraneum]|uniref:Carbon monoxide dehydrogenase n=1 Tax=Caldiarchaeum subterraneum TaxID=311458 RepID=Q4LEB9_CALS0|nr:carbon monoxide dehydrogenase [Candidatus Caldarchaeum subterraneum]BAJ48944.1 carbon monoxide dehydrogenase medium subunit [Candidatus Caldarchaeum subterraneum]BAJ51565.1 carbon monoxide dehydrogenase medium subunit [Candidatus Caldarchaeum subterraneum]